MNTAAVSMESFTRTGTSTSHTTVAPSGTDAHLLDGATSFLILRLIPADGADRAATVTLFSSNDGSACRVSVQVVVSP